MTVTWNGTVHPFAEQFPLIEGTEFDDLVYSIQEHGMREPCTLDPDGTLLDGRNRLRAAEIVGVEPPPWYVEAGDPVAYILDANLHRRHLNPGQIAVITLPVEEHIAAEIEAEEEQTRVLPSADRQKAIPRNAAKEAAEKTGAKERTIRRAKAVQAEAPELLEDVRKGVITLDAAAKEVTRIIKRRKTATGTPVKIASKHPTFNRVNANIGWSGWSWNPMTGCDHGCEYCYARELAENLQSKGTPGYENGFIPTFHPDRLDAPSHTKYPTDAADDARLGRVFVCSMADLFGKWVDQADINAVFAACNTAPWWEYLFLTKFPSRYAKCNFPPNSWAGASVDTQRRVVPTEQAMAKVTAKVRWLSLEPLLEPLVFTDLSMFNIVVIGAQTAVRGTRQYPEGKAEVAPEWDWVNDIVMQARDAGCSVYLKENLLGRRDAQHPGMKFPEELPSGLFIVS